MPSLPTTTEFEPDQIVIDVLIVDDDEDLRYSLLELLQQDGLVTIAAANGRDGLQLALKCSPRLVLLDLNMPVMSGREFLERRRSDAALARIPVVVVTGDPPSSLQRL